MSVKVLYLFYTLLFVCYIYISSSIVLTLPSVPFDPEKVTVTVLPFIATLTDADDPAVPLALPDRESSIYTYI